MRGLLLLMLLLVPAATALNCTYDSQAFLSTTQDIEVSCQLENLTDARCYSIVKYADDVLRIYPDPKYVERIGYVDYFMSRHKLVNVYFGKSDLYELYNYTFAVECGQVNSSSFERFEFNVAPFSRNLDEVGYRGVWLKQNMATIFGILIFALVAAIIIYMIRR